MFTTMLTAAMALAAGAANAADIQFHQGAFGVTITIDGQILPTDGQRFIELARQVADAPTAVILSLQIIGRLLGHSHARTTERYAGHLANDPLQAAVDKISDSAGGRHLRVVNGGQS
jgi:hypothetical protein